MKRETEMAKQKQMDFLIVDGHVVTVSFSPEPNPSAVDRLKQMLLASYADHHRFANPDGDNYDDGGEAHAP